MSKKMLIDASHLEETRVVVLNGTRLEEFDYESAARKQLKGNIYLAKITRVEPSLQAAFVEYGGNRHGFLPFSEIHPDYYRIPIADREALIAEEARFNRDAVVEEPDSPVEDAEVPDTEATAAVPDEPDDSDRAEDGDLQAAPDSDAGSADSDAADNAEPSDNDEADGRRQAAGKFEQVKSEDRVDTVGGDDVEDDARKRARLMRRYKIQEVIKRRQVMLVQVTKEERGNKGAALTTYLSLAGRYCVLMPNTGRGGGISRKIANASDRRRLKKVVSELDIPDGIAVIVRTAGSERTKVEIRRDYEYLMRLWNEIRDSTLQSTAPELIYEEANLIKRAIRDLYSSDMEDILVEGEEGHKAARSFMKSLTPSHARKVKLYKDDAVPLFYRHKVESQLEAMHSQSVQLKSGGSIVINPTEALVAIDVNSGKATRERHIEETALKTNIEAADEVGRQLRLRDLAGLIVIDFIDMEEQRNNREVERRFKDVMRNDRARIQFGRISPFGLLEMSRQRLRPSLFESSTVPCGHCSGSGHIRSVDSAALQILRAIEEEGIRRGGGEVALTLPTSVAFYILNDKRARLTDIEQRYGLGIRIEHKDRMVAPDFLLERISSTGAGAAPEIAEPEEPAESEEDGRRRRGRRRRRRKDGIGESVGEAPAQVGAIQASAADDAEADDESEEREAGVEAVEKSEDDRPKARRRRGKRGGRRRSRRRPDEDESQTESAASEAGEHRTIYEPGAEQPDVSQGQVPEPEEQPLSAPESEAPESEVAESGTAESETAEAAVPKERDGSRERTRAPRRRGRRKAAPITDPEAAPEIAADSAQETTAESPAATSVETEASAEITVESKPKRRRAAAAKPKRTAAGAKPATRRRRKPAAEPAASEPETAAPIGNGGQQPGEAPTPVESPAEIPAFDQAAQPTAQSAAEEPDAAQPKRRGWWQKWV